MWYEQQLTNIICFKTSSIRKQILLPPTWLSSPYAYVVPMKLIILFRAQDISLHGKARIKTSVIFKHCMSTRTICSGIKRKKKNGLTVRLMRKCVCLPWTTQSEEREEGNCWHFLAALRGKKCLAAKYCIVTVKALILYLSPRKKSICRKECSKHRKWWYDNDKGRITKKAGQPAGKVNTLSLIEKLKNTRQSRSSAI